MLNEFCTLFDVNYLSRGLTLYRSLERTCSEFRLRVFCMDDATKDLLDRLDLPRLEAIPLSELEEHDRELVEVKPTRGPIDYLLTATPSICLYSLEREPSLEAITYLDADLMFFGDPAPLFDELGDNSVLITPHRYATAWKQFEAISGIYNVQFLTFRNDEKGLETVRWWRDRCLEWCYFRPEDGKLGDQKYLDDWPERFDRVHVLRHPGGGLAPWNVENHELRTRDGSVLVDDVPLVFYHYHALRLYSGITLLRKLGFGANSFRLARSTTPLVWASGHPIADLERKLIWDPYLLRLGDAVSDIRHIEPHFDAGFTRVDGPRFARAGVARRLHRSSSRFHRRLATARGRDEARAHDHVRSWQDHEVAEQMSELTDRELLSPELVPPFRAFVETVTMLLEDYSLPHPASFLDFGCGVGHYSVLLDRYFPDRFVYTGCDYAAEMVRVARERRPGKTFVVNDLFDNKLDLDSFDVICAGALIDVLSDYHHGLHILLGAGAPYVVLHRQRMTESSSYVEDAPGYADQTTYRSFLNRADLHQIAREHGREISRVVVVDDAMETFLVTKSPL